MMPYVERDGTTAIVGLYARPQPARAEELLADDDPEVVAFENPPKPAPETTATTADDLDRALVTKGVLTATDIETAKKTRTL